MLHGVRGRIDMAIMESIQRDFRAHESKISTKASYSHRGQRDIFRKGASG